MKSQIVVNKNNGEIICTAFSNGKKHDFRLFRESKTHIDPKIKVVVDTGYQGISGLHKNSVLPKKRSKRNPLTKLDKNFNQTISSKRALNEHVIGFVKHFKIIAEKYRNRRKRFALRFNLIAGVYNFELEG